MGIIDPPQILNLIIALGVVALPVELGILLLVKSIKSQVTSKEKRSELIREAAGQLWEPLQQPQQREALITEIAAKMWEPFATPERRAKFIGEASHAFMRALKERGGSLEGVAARVAKAGISDAIGEGGAPELLGKLPGKVKLPVVGNVTIGEAIQLGAALKELFQGGGLRALTGGSSVVQGAGSAAQLP